MSDSRRLVDKLWAYCNVLRDDGVGVIEYTEQLTYLLFLKMAHERATRKLNPQQIVPDEYSWQKLLDAEGTDLEVQYTKILVGLAQQPGTLGTIFRKAQNRIQDPAKLKRLIVDLIDKENWSASGTDLKGDAYEALLSKGASDKGSGAGQYFTPRDLIRAIVDVIDPTPADEVVDPAIMRNFGVSRDTVEGERSGLRHVVRPPAAAWSTSHRVRVTPSQPRIAFGRPAVPSSVSPNPPGLGPLRGWAVAANAPRCIGRRPRTRELQLSTRPGVPRP